MKKSFPIYIFSIICLLCFSVLSASADPVKVAINPDAKPFKYYDENGEFSGIDAEVIRGIAEVKGLELSFVEMDFEKIIDAVANCEVDAAISALTQTEERSKQVKFSRPYVMSLQSAFVRTKNDHLTGISDPAIKVIGAKASTTAEFNSKITAGLYGYELKLYPNYAELFAALESDEIDVAVADELLSKEFVDSYADMMTIGQPLTTEPYAIAVCPANTDLLDLINEGLSELQREGTIDKIVMSSLISK